MAYSTFSQVLTECQKRSRVLVTDTDYISLLGSFINQVHQDILLSRDWPFLSLTGHANLSAPVTHTGLSWTTLTPTITGLTLTASNIGDLLQLSAAPELYKVIAIPAPGTVTVGNNIILPTSTGQVAVRIPASYAAPVNFRMPSVVETFLQSYGIEYVGPRQYLHLASRFAVGNPRNWTIVYDSVVPTPAPAIPLPRFAFYPFPDRNMTYDFMYFPLIADIALPTDLILIPDGYREAVIFGALRRFYSEVLDSEQSAAIAKAEEDKVMSRFLGDYGFFDDKIMLSVKGRKSYGRRRVH